jgi:hypothetical protein
MPTARGSSPAAWMTLAGQLVNAGMVAADFNGFAAVALRWRHEPDAAVAVLVVVPAHKCCHPAASLCHALEWLPGVVRPVLQGVEKRFRVGVVVADPWSGERPEYPKLLQSGFQGGRPHGVAVIGMEDQRLATPIPVTLPYGGQDFGPLLIYRIIYMP